MADVDFVELTPDQQDARPAPRSSAGCRGQADDAGQHALSVPRTPASPRCSRPAPRSELDFFALLVIHTRQGFYADPIYGGNKDQVGWQVIGFPGPASLAEVHTGRYSTLRLVRRQATHETGQGDGHDDAS